MGDAEAKALLEKYGIPLPKEDVAKSMGDAVSIAEKLGYPVVLKILSPDILHKTEAGGVLLDIKNRAEVERGYKDLLRKAKAYKENARIEGVLVQRQASKGREVIVGTLRDEQFDSVVMFGLGGVFVEVLKDVSFRIAPIDKSEALKMIREIKGYPVLRGVRGDPPADTKAIAGVIAAASRIAHEREDILEMDINPLIVYPKGALAVDVRIILA
jgi:acetyl-CoA synthetase (ADP-forming)